MESVDSLDRLHALRAIEALRSGVPSRDAVRALGSATPDIESRFTQLLESAQRADGDPTGPAGQLVTGNFGSGKSHLLESLQERALDAGFVTSRVVISKETPLYDPIRFFRAAIGAAQLPGRVGNALPLLAEALDPRSEACQVFIRWAHQVQPDLLNQRFAATLFLFEVAHQDPEIFERVLAFWAGDPLTLGDLKRALRTQGARTAYLFDKIDPRTLAYHRFRFLCRLILAAGYPGWVLLVDEVELIGRYGLVQRARSYAELARWTGGLKQDRYPGLRTVFALTSDYESVLIDGRRDRELAPNKLRAGTRAADQELAVLAEHGIRLIGRALKMPLPSRVLVRRTYEKIRRLHGAAYGWEPPAVSSAPYAGSTSMREYIRWWITEWDLTRLYPSYVPDIEVSPLTVEYDEDADLAADPEWQAQAPVGDSQTSPGME